MRILEAIALKTMSGNECGSYRDASLVIIQGIVLFLVHFIILLDFFFKKPDEPVGINVVSYRHASLVCKASCFSFCTSWS